MVTRALSPEARQAPLGPAGGKGAVQPALAKRPARRCLLLGPDPRIGPPQPPAQSLPGRATERPPWEVHGARFLLLPPAPRAEAVARATELAVQRGSALSATGASSLFGPRGLATRERRRGGGAGGRPPTHLRARATATTPGGQRHPEPPQPLLPPPPETPLRKSDHWSEAATLPDMVPPSSPSTSPFPHTSLPSRSNCGTEVRLPRSDNAFGSRARWCPLSSVPIRKVGSNHWFQVSK